MSVSPCIYWWAPAEDVILLLAVGLTGSYDPPEMAAGNYTQVPAEQQEL